MGQLQKMKYICNGIIRRRRKKGTELINEAIITENSPRLVSDTKPHMQEAQRAPSKINAQGTYKGGM